MKYAFVFLALFVLAAPAAGQGAKDTVRTLMHEQQEAWNEGDLRTFMEPYWKSDSLKFISRRGVTYGWQKVLDNYMSSYPDRKAMGTLTFDLIAIEALGDSCMYVVGKWVLSGEKPAGGHFSLLWKKIGGRWVIVADHTS